MRKQFVAALFSALIFTTPALSWVHGTSIQQAQLPVQMAAFTSTTNQSSFDIPITTGGSTGAYDLCYSAKSNNAGSAPTDDAGGTWTLITSNNFAHAPMAHWVRMAGSAPLAPGNKITVRTGFNTNVFAAQVFNIPDATGISQTATVTPPQDVNLQTVNYNIPAPAVSNSWQLSCYAAWPGAAAAFPSFGSDDSVVPLAAPVTVAAGTVGQNVTQVVLARKGPQAGPFPMVGYAVTGNNYQTSIYAEFQTSAAGVTTASGLGDVPLISGSQVLSKAFKGIGGSYNIGVGDMGALAFNSSIGSGNSAATPLSFTCPSNSSATTGGRFASLQFTGANSFTFQNCGIYGVTSASAGNPSAVKISGGSANLSFLQLVLNSGASTSGPYPGNGYLITANGTGADANIQIIGRNDSSFVDLQGYVNGVGFGVSRGGLVQNMTMYNVNTDFIDVYGGINITIDHNLFYGNYLATTNHADVIQWAGDSGGSGTATSNLVITNNGYLVDKPGQTGAQQSEGGYLGTGAGPTGSNIFLSGNWELGAAQNAMTFINTIGGYANDNFLQSTAGSGWNVLVNSSTVANVDRNSYGGVATTNGGVITNTPTGNIILPVAASTVDFSQLDPWLALHPGAHRR